MELRSRGGFVALSTLCLMIVLSSYLLLSEDQSIPIERLSRYSDDEEDLAESMRSVLQQSGAELPKELANDRYHWHSQQDLYKVNQAPNNVCDENTDILVMVITAPSSIYHRTVYRETVLSAMDKLPTVRYSFLIGLTENASLSQEIQREGEKYDDIFVGNFIDSYENLTLKSIFMLNVASEFCPKSKFIFKLDDDVYANLKAIKTFLDGASHERYIYGSIFKGAKPIRNTNNKWHIKHYDGSEFPTYVSGTAYIITTDIVVDLFRTALWQPFLRLEDVFTTGICPRESQLVIRHQTAPNFGYNKIEDFRQLNPSAYTLHGLNDEQLRYIWSKVKV